MEPLNSIESVRISLFENLLKNALHCTNNDLIKMYHYFIFRNYRQIHGNRHHQEVLKVFLLLQFNYNKKIRRKIIGTKLKSQKKMWVVSMLWKEGLIMTMYHIHEFWNSLFTEQTEFKPRMVHLAAPTHDLTSKNTQTVSRILGLVTFAQNTMGEGPIIVVSK